MRRKLSKFEGLKCILVCQVSTREEHCDKAWVFVLNNTK